MTRRQIKQLLTQQGLQVISTHVADNGQIDVSFKRTGSSLDVIRGICKRAGLTLHMFGTNGGLEYVFVSPAGVGK